MFLQYKRVLSNEQKLKSQHTLHEKCLYLEFFWSVFPVFWQNTENAIYLSVFIPNAGKYGPEKLRIPTLFTQWHET